MIRILLKLWPAFIPLILYGIWYYRNIGFKKDVKIIDLVIEKKKKYAFYTVVSSCILVISMLLYFALTEPATPHIDIQNDQVNVK